LYIHIFNYRRDWRKDDIGRVRVKERREEKHSQKWQEEPGTGGHACYPSYSGGRDKEDHGWRPAQTNSSQDPSLENTQHKKGLVEWSRGKSTCLASVRP
jgi:hypothetical protein